MIITQKKIRTFYDVPGEFITDKEIIALQRKLGHRISNLRGYDVINDEFFVEESVAWDKEGRKYSYRERKTTFPTFGDYYNFLDGDIYENACYYQYVFTDDLICNYKIDFGKLNFTIKLDTTIDNLKSNVSERKQKYTEGKKKLKERKAWIEKFNETRTYDDFMSVVHKYQKNHSYYDIDFYVWNYIEKRKTESFDIVIKYLSSKGFFDERMIYAMCFIFGAEKVGSNFKYTGMAQSTNAKHNASFSRFVNQFESKDFVRKQKTFFDTNSGYYCTRTDIYESEDSWRSTASLYKYFETIEELGEYLNYDFSNCDFTDAFELSEEKIVNFNENTKFPIKAESQLNRVVSSGYHRTQKEFYVKASFYSKQLENIYCTVVKRFNYFFEFVSYLNHDLGNANLIFCDGLENLTDYSNLNIENAKVVSAIKEKIGVKIESSVIEIEEKQCDFVENNEAETSLVLQNNRAELSQTETLINDEKIYYITDLHLEHRLRYAECKTEEDCLYAIPQIVDSLLREIKFEIGKNELLLIGGDTASTFWIFEQFVKALRSTIQERALALTVIFTLGNHELWEFADCSVDTIASKYRAILKENEMYLLQNEVLCVFDGGVESFSPEISETKLKQARAILFGGIGFSGANEAFNANNGIYRATVSRNTETEESDKLKKAYESLCEQFSREQIIVFTHMPFEDWCGKVQRHENYIYISGHNHKNEYYDDGTIRVFSDNQIGYSKVQPRLKYFYFSYEFDLFEDYEDGIYEITREEYRDFHRGKKLGCNCNSANKIYMLKRDGYYCFIHQNKSKDLAIMNGGSKRTLKSKDVNYYYENMDSVIASLKSPFDIYSKAQRQISGMIKKFGGTGTIHGAIIDINYFNHIYLNPFDFSATPYYATDIFYKRVYPDLGQLLECHCPEYYQKYEMLSNSGDGDIVLKTNTELLKAPKLYMDTDIYSASREIKKMQKLNSNILTLWPENIEGNKTIGQRKLMRK